MNRARAKVNGTQSGEAVNEAAKSAGRRVAKGAQKIGTFVLCGKDFALSFAVSAFGIKKPVRTTTRLPPRKK